MSISLTDNDWKILIKRIKRGKCTPFLGAGACYGVLPLGSDIAQKWAKEYNYPDIECNDLVRIAQYLAINNDPMFPKDELVDLFEENHKCPAFNSPYEPHNVLSELPLPVYMTTNYDDFMTQALKLRNKNPVREFCKWNSALKSEPSVFDNNFIPSASNPVVYHFHGIIEKSESLVLTEDDYLDFLVKLSKEEDTILPLPIKQALSGSSLLFIGYKLEDWDFKVLFRGLVVNGEKSLRRINVTVQLPPVHEDLRKYQDDYFNKMDIKVYWGTASDFVKELKNKWREFSNDNKEQG
jgi:hypothetical protein